MASCRMNGLLIEEICAVSYNISSKKSNFVMLLMLETLTTTLNCLV